MVRFVHVGDVHLQAGHPRNADRLASLDQIVVEGLQLEHLAAWLIPGDLFHSRSTVADRNDLAERLTRMADVAPICLVRGNHDQPNDLDIFAKLKARWPIYLATRPGVIMVPLATGDTAAIACLPYPDRFGLVAAGVAPGDVVPTAGELLDVICMQLAHELEVPRVSGAIPLFAGHVNVRGAIVSTGQPSIGVEIELDQAMLARLPVAYCALNHIHRPQEVGAGVFAGSIAACDHGETEKKSYVVVEAVRRRDGSWEASWVRRPLVTPPMVHVEGELTRDGFSWQVVGEEAPHDGAAIDWTGCDVRVRYTFKASERAALNEDLVRPNFTGALRLKVEPIAVPDRALRSQAVADARTLADKLTAYAAVAGVVATESVLAKLARLESTDPPRLLADVALFLHHIETPPDETAHDDPIENETHHQAQPVLKVAS